MSTPPGPARNALGSFAPKLVELTDETLFGDVWNRQELPARERCLITVAALITLGRADQLRFHLGKAMTNGVSVDELVEVVTHLAFYAGWPAAMSAITILREFADENADD